jgi:hypothetical protein
MVHLVLTAVALALRLAPLLHGATQRPTPSASREWIERPVLKPSTRTAVNGNDPFEYFSLAQGLRAGCGFAQLLDHNCWLPEVSRNPGYPLFLALSPSLTAAVFVQALLGAFGCLIVGLFVARRWNPAAGLLAAAFIAVDAPSIVASSSIMADSLFQFLVL